MSLDECIDFPHKFLTERVCSECFCEKGVISFYKKYSKSNGCDYCDSEAPSYLISNVIDHIIECVHREYSTPIDSMIYDSKLGYVGTAYESEELLEQVGLSETNELF